MEIFTDPAIIAAAQLSYRYITDRQLPDKAIDLVDEAASLIRMEMDSKPEEMDKLERRLIQLKIEREALKKDTDKATLKRLKVLEQEIGMELVNHAPVVFRQDDEIQRVPRDKFAEMAASGKVGLDTTVFNNTLTRLGDVRAGRWETRVANSWHGRAFF